MNLNKCMAKCYSNLFIYRCDVARIEKVVDNVPADHLTIWKIKHVSWLTRLSAVYWLNSVSPNLRGSIEAAFGALPDVDCEEKFWETPDGPSWLWWFIAILPLKMEIKVNSIYE